MRNVARFKVSQMVSLSTWSTRGLAACLGAPRVKPHLIYLYRSCARLRRWPFHLLLTTRTTTITAAAAAAATKIKTTTTTTKKEGGGVRWGRAVERGSSRFAFGRSFLSDRRFNKAFVAAKRNVLKT